MRLFNSLKFGQYMGHKTMLPQLTQLAPYAPQRATGSSSSGSNGDTPDIKPGLEGHQAFNYQANQQIDQLERQKSVIPNLVANGTLSYEEGMQLNNNLSSNINQMKAHNIFYNAQMEDVLTEFNKYQKGVNDSGFSQNVYTGSKGRAYDPYQVAQRLSVSLGFDKIETEEDLIKLQKEIENDKSLINDPRIKGLFTKPVLYDEDIDALEYILNQDGKEISIPGEMALTYDNYIDLIRQNPGLDSEGLPTINPSYERIQPAGSDDYNSQVSHLTTSIGEFKRKTSNPLGGDFDYETVPGRNAIITRSVSGYSDREVSDNFDNIKAGIDNLLLGSDPEIERELKEGYYTLLSQSDGSFDFKIYDDSDDALLYSKIGDDEAYTPDNIFSYKFKLKDEVLDEWEKDENGNYVSNKDKLYEVIKDPKKTIRKSRAEQRDGFYEYKKRRIMSDLAPFESFSDLATNRKNVSGGSSGSGNAPDETSMNKAQRIYLEKLFTPGVDVRALGVQTETIDKKIGGNMQSATYNDPRFGFSTDQDVLAQLDDIHAGSPIKFANAPVEINNEQHKIVTIHTMNGDITFDADMVDMENYQIVSVDGFGAAGTPLTRGILDDSYKDVYNYALREKKSSYQKYVNYKNSENDELRVFGTIMDAFTTSGGETLEFHKQLNERVSKEEFEDFIAAFVNQDGSLSNAPGGILQQFSAELSETEKEQFFNEINNIKYIVGTAETLMVNGKNYNPESFATGKVGDRFSDGGTDYNMYLHPSPLLAKLQTDNKAFIAGDKEFDYLGKGKTSFNTDSGLLKNEALSFKVTVAVPKDDADFSMLMGSYWDKDGIHYPDESAVKTGKNRFDGHRKNDQVRQKRFKELENNYKNKGKNPNLFERMYNTVTDEDINHKFPYIEGVEGDVEYSDDFYYVPMTIYGNSNSLYRANTRESVDTYKPTGHNAQSN